MFPFGFGYFDPTMILLIPSIILAMYAQSKVKSTFAKYLRVGGKKGYTGYQVARHALDNNGIGDVPVEITRGQLTDHYDPRRRVVRLSNEVYNGHSLASISIAAHETGHAIQHANGYIPLSFRNAIFPIASFGSNVAWIFIILGLIMSLPSLLDLGILLFSAAVLFQVVTLPVEFNASGRALRLLDEGGFIADDEYKHSKKILNAAALTYVAAMATAISQLIRLLLIRDRRRN
ncbi:MAG: zinc metallopeptidase [Natronincolaceae bacterium]|jgi:Zn-dependent membrane protease YugP|nr:zinc metallopeptidase [Bacillota bacterium]NLK91089.1 zinc metallopeptidase [Clostridiales bacterium]